MIYNNFADIKISSLGYGCMRFPLDGDGKIDKAETKKLIDYAMANGINYYDTAWGYLGGESEIVTGKLLSQYPRDSYYLASKFPGYDLNNMDKVEEIFERQLEKCGVEYFDFYLFHNVCEYNIDAYLNSEYGIYDYLIEQKKNGRIKHLGFSTHGSFETITRFLDAYGDDMEFCQIQLNWLDWEFQDAKRVCELLNKKNIPIWVMEPVRGGRLTTLVPKYADKLKEINSERTLAEWAFDFVKSVSGVALTLSGMSTMEQLKENVRIFSNESSLTSSDIDALIMLGREITKIDFLPCTSCKYCTEGCPMGINIPRIVDLYNEYLYSGIGNRIMSSINSMEDDKKPSACIGCQACEALCPQNIKISEMMKKFADILKK
ncbi:MAG: aldo/keto reductase [Clostridia bacterium]|nr:aldo/keto reductase [Clostridia bacterium]